MKNLFSKLHEPALFALRVVVGGMFACHGVQKLFGGFGEPSLPVGSQLWIGGLIELVTGVLIAVGLVTRLASFLASGTMAVAYFQFHVDGVFADWHWLPMVNKGELAVVYCFLFLVFATSGPGRISLDRVVGLEHSPTT